MRGVLLWGLLLASCHAAPAKERVLQIGEPWAISPVNPALAGEGFLADAAYLIFDSLIDFDDKLNPIPRLLERWEARAGSRIWRLQLKADVRFQDGHRMGSDDLAFTLDEIRRPSNEN